MTDHTGLGSVRSDTRKARAEKQSVVHASPPQGHATTPCCSTSPFELPGTDRMTLDPEYVTCTGTGA